MATTPKTIIPKDKLAFCWATIKEKETFGNSYIANTVPFDITELPDGERKWDYLKKICVEALIEREELPTHAKAQNYDRGAMSYVAYSTLEGYATYYSTGENEKSDKVVTMKIDAGALNKIILPEDFKQQIVEAVAQLKEYKLIFNTWGFGDVVTKGRGVNMLFSGVSGTGKTFCGELIAEYTGLKAELISVASIESKYVGESEQNVANLFKGLADSKKVLILDEVDSFLSSRKNADSHPHYSKLTNQFLVELERHNGICIMTTNRPVVLDKALARRIDVVLDFPFPNQEARKAIWERHMPKTAPFVNPDVDVLAQFVLTGGQIKNALLKAARRAVVSGTKEITQDMLIAAAKREFETSEQMKVSKDMS